MKQLMILLTVLILSGCAVDRAPLPDWNNAKQDFGDTTYPTTLPLLCKIPWDTLECWSAIERYEEIAEANAQMAGLNASALNKTEQAYTEAIEAGAKQQWTSERYRQMYEEEKTEHFWSNIKYQGVILLGILGAVL